MKRFRGYLVDLDGTIYLGHRALTGAVETTAKLRAGGPGRLPVVVSWDRPFT